MKWLWVLLCAPAMAGDFGVFADAWTNEDREESIGFEYIEDGDWRPSLTVGAYENIFGESSWYGGIGVRKSLWDSGAWDMSAGLSAMYFKHDSSESITTVSNPQGPGLLPVTQTVIRHYEREEYVTAAPSLRMSYKAFGLNLVAFESPERDITTALQLSYTF